MTSRLSRVQRRRSGTQRWLHKPAGQSLSGCAAAPPDLLLVGVQSSGQQQHFLMETWRSTNSYGLGTIQEQFVGWVQRRRSGTQHWLHKPAGQSLSGCAGAPPDLRFPLHPTYDKVLSGCAGAPPDLRPRFVGWRCCSTQPETASGKYPASQTLVLLRPTDQCASRGEDHRHADLPPKHPG